MRKGWILERELRTSAKLTMRKYSNPSDAYESIESLEVPFASRRKMKATIHKLDKGSFMGIKFGTKHLAVVKGAPDRLLPFVDAEDDEAFLGTLAESNEEYAGAGLRILFTCVRPVDDELLTRSMMLKERTSAWKFSSTRRTPSHFFVCLA